MVAVIVTGKTPVWVGVPEMIPVVVLKLRPGGRPVAAKPRAAWLGGCS